MGARRHMRYHRIDSKPAISAAHRALSGFMANSRGRAGDEATKYAFPGMKLIGAPLPKVGSSSVRKLVQELGHTLGESAINVNGIELRQAYPDHYIFSFVRNPWLRIYSCWKDKIDECNSISKVARLSRFKGLRPFAPFEEFAEWLADKGSDDRGADPHWMSQMYHLRAQDDDITSQTPIFADFVGRMETMQEDWERMQRETGVELPPIGRANASRGVGTSDFRDHYTPRTRDLIASRYAAEIERFGFDF